MVGTLDRRGRGEVAARKRAILAEFDEEEQGEGWFGARAARWILGTPDEARAEVAAFEAAGVERLMLQDFLPRDLEMIDLLGAELVRH